MELAWRFRTDCLWGSGVAPGREAAALPVRREQGEGQAWPCSAAALVRPHGEGHGGAASDPPGLGSSGDLPDPAPVLGGGAW